MKTRALMLLAGVGLAAGLLWLDQNRGGPASMLSRCNLLLSRGEAPAADVLILGSSRSGTALDPIALEKMLAPASSGGPKVERIALPHNPLRANYALLENYVANRGAPKVLVLEIMFMSRRSVDLLAQRQLTTLPEHYIFRRDINLLTFEQLLTLPAVAMPFTEDEGWISQWRMRLRGAVLRAGALTYQFLRNPAEQWDIADCGRDEWTREPVWPPDFAFSFGDYEPAAPLPALIDILETEIAAHAAARELKTWQTESPGIKRYAYDFEAPYRRGELAFLDSILRLAGEHGAKVVLLPMPTYGHKPGAKDLRALRRFLPEHAQLFNVYAQIRGNFDTLWHDDGHIEIYPTGALTTALVAKRLVDGGLVDGEPVDGEPVDGGAVNRGRPATRHD